MPNTRHTSEQHASVHRSTVPPLDTHPRSSGSLSFGTVWMGTGCKSAVVSAGDPSCVSGPVPGGNRPSRRLSADISVRSTSVERTWTNRREYVSGTTPRSMR